MPRAKLELVQVAAAVFLPLALVAVAGWFSWTDRWQRAEGELYRTADAATEYAQRMIASALLGGRMTNNLLDGASDEEIRQEEAEYHSRLAQIMADVPGANIITVSDRDGMLLLMSTAYPVPRISVADREWVQALQAPDAAEVHVGSLARGRVNGDLFFSVSIPRTDTGNARVGGEYDGLVNVSLDPSEIAAGLATTTHEPTDVIALVRSDGAILSTTRGLRHDMPRIPAESLLLGKIEAGETRGMYEGQALGLRDGVPIGGSLSIAFRKVGELPVYVTVSRTPAAIVAPWLRTMAGLLAVGLPASLALGLLAWMAVRQRDSLSASQAELAATFDSAATGTALVDGTSRLILKVNRRLCDLSGREAGELIGMTLDQILDPGPTERDVVGAAAGLDRLHRPDGSVRWVECATAPVTRTRKDAPALVVATFHDVTERKQSEELQTLLAREVDHRAKNVLAIVQAVIRLGRDPEAAMFAEKIEGRVKALARAHELLAKDSWQGADLSDLIRDELSPYQDGARVTISGTTMRIVPAAVQPLSMALHELATNAVQHGALGRPEGDLAISWRQSTPESALELLWQERGGGEAGSERDAGGAGLRILQGSVEQLGGTVALNWQGQGLSCCIELPVRVLAAGDGEKPGESVRQHSEYAPDAAGSLAGKRVLIVEDEVIVAMDLAQMVTALGCTVIGPAQNLEAAYRFAQQEAGRLDAAILDVNLNGATTVDVAHQLHGLGTPCIFVSGYSELPKSARMDWTLLRKPVGEHEIATALRHALGSAFAIDRTVAAPQS